MDGGASLDSIGSCDTPIHLSLTNKEHQTSQWARKVYLCRDAMLHRLQNTTSLGKHNRVQRSE